MKPYLADWLAMGEEARIYDGELPHKLAIFDSQVVLVPLIRAGEQTRTLVIRHAQLARSLSMLFQFLWERSEPFSPRPRKRNRIANPPLPGTGGNGRHTTAKKRLIP